MKVETYNLIAILAVLVTIVVLSKIGGTGADLAIMTALVAILGGLTQNFRKATPLGATETGDVNVSKEKVK